MWALSEIHFNKYLNHCGCVCVAYSIHAKVLAASITNTILFSLPSFLVVVEEEYSASLSQPEL